MSIDPVLINKINKKISEENQLENLADEILDYLKKKDLDQLNTEERIKLIESILLKIKISNLI